MRPPQREPTKNRQHLLKHRIGQALFDEVAIEADRRGLLSGEHFTVDGSLIEAAASLKSFKPRNGDPPAKTDLDPGNHDVQVDGEHRGQDTMRTAGKVREYADTYKGIAIANDDGGVGGGGPGGRAGAGGGGAEPRRAVGGDIL